MIKFFRKIRQNLLSENKFSKYLIYAIGEIVLVVIGILIALWINNWNQNRINKSRINGYLSSIITDLKSDIVEYERVIMSYEIGIENNSRILINDNYQQLEVDSIANLILGFWNANRISSQTFQKIQSIGLQETLGTPEIEKAVNDYYNIYISQYNYLINWDKELTDRDNLFWNYNDKFETGLDRRLELSSIPYQSTNEKRKEELIKLTESTLGRNYLKNAVTRDKYGIITVSKNKSIAENLIELIEKEIKK
ncbi:hypothetical protein E1J38_014970 [Seonamhaeicola sediminis]|uniref:Uncharacterized protein n=1 Tax=Seonamhaeicola sediminis TaxID=2528206 RepID=A0A562Y5K3_9FLAO|nr:DUF6090 family protein [Seonamhaeicola sediminis]TWO29623.1 hypothetical protein E1J38_014970 [Seonamhaeicola sediminis]